MHPPQNEEIAISQYREQQHGFLVRTIKQVQQENARLILLGRAQKRHYESRIDALKGDKERLKERLNTLTTEI